MNDNEFIFKNAKAFDSELNVLIKRKLGGRVFISQAQALDKSRMNLILGINVPQFIDDAKSGIRKIRFLKFDSIGLMETKKEKGEIIRVILPNTNELTERISTKMDRLVFKVESTLLQSLYKKLVRIPLVSNSLDPIRDVLVEVYDNNEFNYATFKKRRGELKATKYVHFLTSLELIRQSEKSENTFVAGNQFNQAQKEFGRDSTQIYNTLLAYVLKNGLGYIKEYLKLSAINQYIKLSTSYYLPSSESGMLLSVTNNMLIQYHSNIYGEKPAERKTSTRISHMVDAGILNNEEDRFLIGTPDVLRDTEMAFAQAI